MSDRKRSPGAVLCLLPLAVGGCVPSVALEPAPQVTSAHWSSQNDGQVEAPASPTDVATPSLGAMFRSAELDGLIHRALEANADGRAARARIRQARALLASARGNMLPLVSASAGISGTTTQRPTTDPFNFSEAFAGLDISFDLDLFGAGRAERRAAQHRVSAAEYDLGATRIAIECDVARAYVQRAALNARILLLERNLQLASELERIIRARVNAGDATQVDLGLQMIQVRQLGTDKLRLDESLDRTRTALAVLLGEEAPSFRIEPAPLESLSVPTLALLQPSALLVHRPDVRASEERIEAAGGDVQQARAAFFPRIQLSASALAQAASLSGPLGSTFSIGSSLLAPIFNRGRLRANLELMAGRQVESVELYRQVLLTALSEVENALSSVDHARRREVLLGEIVDEARLTSRLAHIQYLEGEADLQRLFDAQQRLSEAEDARAVVVQERLEAAINLFQSLGGAGAAAG
jgi:NodT family efflux transporter outer membrane factor (OMF) lipoprotein